MIWSTCVLLLYSFEVVGHQLISRAAASHSSLLHMLMIILRKLTLFNWLIIFKTTTYSNGIIWALIHHSFSVWGQCSACFVSAVTRSLKYSAWALRILICSFWRAKLWTYLLVLDRLLHSQLTQISFLSVICICFLIIGVYIPAFIIVP